MGQPAPTDATVKSITMNSPSRSVSIFALNKLMYMKSGALRWSIFDHDLASWDLIHLIFADAKRMHARVKMVRIIRYN